MTIIDDAATPYSAKAISTILSMMKCLGENDDTQSSKSSVEMTALCQKWVDAYPIVSIEDGPGGK